MRVSPAQRGMLRFGAVMLLLAAVVLAAVAVLADSGDAADDGVTPVADPAEIALPATGLFGGGVVVYGAVEQPGLGAEEFGCRLLSSGGREQSAAKMTYLSVLGVPPVSVDGERLQPLFEVSSYTDGSVVACDDLGSVAPVAVTAPSTFGGLGGAVRAFAAGAALLCLALGVGGLVLLRSRTR